MRPPEEVRIVVPDNLPLAMAADLLSALDSVLTSHGYAATLGTVHREDIIEISAAYVGTSVADGPPPSPHRFSP